MTTIIDHQSPDDTGEVPTYRHKDVYSERIKNKAHLQTIESGQRRDIIVENQRIYGCAVCNVVFGSPEELTRVPCKK